YGNLAYGVEAAAETYFRTTADKLTLAQAAFLAGLPQAPAIYDIHTNREVTLKRFSDVLVLMYRVSQEQGCIYVSNSPQPVCVDAVAATRAREEILNYTFPSPNVPMRHPHWVNYIRQQLEDLFDVQTIYRSGFTVYTTLDSELQQLAERLVKEHVSGLREKNVKTGALVAIHPPSGEILAMVGSADFYDEAIDGQVNMALSPRQPGSSIKPITYLAAFEKGWTPATLIWDVPSEFPPSGRPEDRRPPFKPVNYDGKFHGPVTVRAALANSYNVPAVKALQFVGIYDDPLVPGEDGFLAMAKRLGITTLTREDYGLSLTLGGGEVSLLELTNVYAILANMGRKTPLISITKILDHQGNLVYEAPRGPVQQVLRPEHVFLITSILSDNEARAPMFGRNSPLNLPFPAAVKTGTTNDFRDNWTIGYTPELAVGVWVGNADYTPMSEVSGISGAAPIWSAFMREAVPRITGGKPSPFIRPAGIVDRVICAVSGTEPSQWCPKQTTEMFAADQPPLPKEQDLWHMAQVDTWTGLRASAACSDFVKEEFVLNVTDPFAIEWIREDPEGRRWAKQNGFDKKIRFVPERECRPDDPRPKLEFISPRDGDTITAPSVNLYLVADATEWFQSFQVDYGLGTEPTEWTTIIKRNEPARANDAIAAWDVSNLPNGLVTLRLTVFSTEETYAEKSIRVILQVPTPTPTSTPTPTQTLTPTFTPTPTSTETPLPTSTVTPTLTPSP
ncbi:MAG: penicillin-binding transpeptidase domain-containing protein, partial [Anaerolineales bacterium]|nr:penicillin-binding transpeptidase domain-containing protein [Anaerolineales bacterium]MDW8446296.1 penicillin-binding transpeptidase domain-containing protein [Anaerolineales bacterium]